MQNTYQSLGGQSLKHYLSIKIDRSGRSVRVFVLSDFHVNKENEVSFTFSKEFTDYEILFDKQLARWVESRYGYIYNTFPN